MSCLCNGIVNQLLNQEKGLITSYLRKLEIIDLENVFVVCLDLQRDGNIYKPTTNSSIYLQGQFQQTDNPSKRIVSAPGVYVVLGNPHKWGCLKIIKAKNDKGKIHFTKSTGNKRSFHRGLCDYSITDSRQKRGKGIKQ